MSIGPSTCASTSPSACPSTRPSSINVSIGVFIYVPIDMPIEISIDTSVYVCNHVYPHQRDVLVLVINRRCLVIVEMPTSCCGRWTGRWKFRDGCGNARIDAHVDGNIDAYADGRAISFSRRGGHTGIERLAVLNEVGWRQHHRPIDLHSIT